MSAPAWTARAARGPVIFLITTVGVEFLHRQLLAVAMVTMLPELRLSDTEGGMLVFAFAAAYAVSAPAIGRIADHANRRNLYAAGIAGWSIATVLGAACSGFVALIATRVLFGAAQGVSGACNGPLVADYVPPERRSGVMGLGGVGAALGVITAMTAGAVATERFGWRATFVWSGVLGVAFALAFVAFVREPARGWSEGRLHAQGERPSWRQVLSVLASMAALRHVMVSAVLANTALLAVAQWSPTYFVRVHHLSLAEGGLAGGIGGLFTVCGGVAGGVLADRAWVRRPRSVLRIPALCFALAFPLAFAAFRAPNAWLAIALLVPAMALGMVHNAPVNAAVQSLTPLRMRALVSGGFNATITLVAMGGGPLLTGWLSDRFDAAGDGSGLARALAWSSLLYLWAGLHLFLAARSFAADLERSQAAA